MLVVLGKIDFLAVILVLLLAPLDSHTVDVIDCEISNVVISEALFLLIKEGEVVPGQGK